MAHVTADRVRDTSTTTGTGAFSVSGTAPTGYRTFSAVLSTSDTCWYAIQHQTAAEWEVGLGTYSSLNTITRTTVLASSNAGSAVNFSAGTKDIFITLAATKTVQQDNSGAVTIDANSSSDALRVTQTGAGNALLVEDSANPDSTPFVVNANGVVGIGESSPGSYLTAGMVIRSSSAFAPQILVWNTTNDTSAPYWNTRKDRAGAIVNNGDALGTFVFQGYDGTDYRSAAYIGANVDGTPGASDMPGRLVFFTTPDGSISAAERMRITSAGNVGIGTTSPSQKLTVNGSVAANSFILATNQHLIYDLDATNIAIRIGAAGPFYAIGTTGSSNLRLNNLSIGDILFAQAGTERMRITSAGAVLIGTTTATGNTLTTVNTDSTTTSITNQYHQYNSGATSGSGTKTGSNILMVALPAYAGTGAFIAQNSSMTSQSPNTVSQFRSFSSSYVSTGGGTLSNFYGYFADNPTLTSGTVTNTYGFYGSMAAGTGKWNFYAAGTANNYFAGNVGIGTGTFGTSASKVLALGNATAPTTGPADTIQIYSTDLSAGNTMLSLYTEGTPVNANTTAAATHRIAISVNGTVYYLLANTSA